MMDHINQAALEVTASIYKEYPRIHDEIFIKFKGDELLKDHIRNLRHDMLGKLIRVNGVITRRSQVFN
jgi:DNA replication licensing factor MCM2